MACFWRNPAFAGFYRVYSVFRVLGFMPLSRWKLSVDGADLVLRFCTPIAIYSAIVLSVLFALEIWSIYSISNIILRGHTWVQNFMSIAIALSLCAYAVTLITITFW